MANSDCSNVANSDCSNHHNVMWLNNHNNVMWLIMKVVIIITIIIMITKTVMIIQWTMINIKENTWDWQEKPHTLNPTCSRAWKPAKKKIEENSEYKRALVH